MKIIDEFNGYKLDWMVKAIIYTDQDFNQTPEQTLDLIEKTVSLPVFNDFESHVYNFKRPGKFGDKFLKRLKKDLENGMFESVIICDKKQINDSDHRVQIFMNPHYKEKFRDNEPRGYVELLMPFERSLENQKSIYEWFLDEAEQWEGVYGYVTIYVGGLYPDEFYKSRILNFPIDCLNAGYYHNYAKRKLKDIFWLNLVTANHQLEELLSKLALEDHILKSEAIVFSALDSLNPETWDEDQILRKRMLVDDKIVRHSSEDKYVWHSNT